MNDGQRTVAKNTTDAYTLRANLAAVAGTVQTLPADAISLIDVIKNVSDGRAILQSDYAIVDILSSTWRSAATGPAENFFYNENNPKQFEVYPPQAGGENIEILYRAQPADATLSGNIIIDDMYADALIDYVAYRAFSKDTEDASPELGRAGAFFSAFMIATGAKDSFDQQVEPGRS
jgi:hypothetical protein